MIFSSQNMMWIALQVILDHLRLLPNFWPKKSNYLEKDKITWIYHHFTPASQKS